MSTLSSELRSMLEASVVAGRRAAEAAARAAIDGLGVFEERRPEHLDEGRARLRVGLRAKWRQLGDEPELLIAEAAYEQWHRLLFARFLAENNLLLHPEFGAPVTLEECDELAAELGEPDGWSVAARFAAEVLPGIFRLEDPCVQLRLAPEGRDALEQILAGLPADVFRSDDALGWVYQYWQKEKKDEVNRAERKIGGADLGPVTQLFTEHYMVRFLLENSLGAWWAARHPASPLVETFEYLRLDDDGQPATGQFDAWPERVAEVTVIDPCCGSGHFLVEAFSMLWQMRAEEEGRSPTEAQDAVLRDNLFGLELDPRCVEIAMFAVALHSWKAGGGWRQLPVPNIACSGIPVKASTEQWTGLFEDDSRLSEGVARLHTAFRHADSLGSLIDPPHITGSPEQASLLDVTWKEVGAALLKSDEGETPDPANAVLGISVSAIARAASLLSQEYSLVVTNVPYLGAARQSLFLQQWCEERYPRSRWDLATVMMSRLSKLLIPGGACATVSPSAWTFLRSYEGFRKDLVESRSLRVIARLGPGAFAAISGHVVQPVLTITTRGPAEQFLSCDVSQAGSASEKALALRVAPLLHRAFASLRRLPDVRITFAEIPDLPLLSEYADSYWGIGTGDGARFIAFHWEQPRIDRGWVRLQGTFRSGGLYVGRTQILRWEDGKGALRDLAEELRDRLKNIWRRGQEAWGHAGVAVNQTGTLHATSYSGEIFQNGVAAVIPKSPADLAAIHAFITDAGYDALVRQVDTKVGVTNLTLLKVPFDLDHWRAVAAERYPDGLPDPWSDDPTQWLFEGRPEVSTAPLQVAVARLSGYRWPEQSESDELDVFADADGIVCLPAVAQEPPAAHRLEELLRTAYGDQWSPTLVGELLAQAGSKKTLAEWLRDEFFKQHCALFGNRPFVWHIWDGLRDGFAALVNYHRLDRHGLEKLTYTYLGQDWVERQRAAARVEEPGADQRLAAALELQRKLEAILAGEQPLDIFVRWKELRDQPIGWEPDLNDGVRLNIRPFVEAGVLRSKLGVHWRKDRGKNPDGSERHNDVHLTLAEKHAARADWSG